MDNKQVKYVGPSLNIILAVVFIVLKLCNVIDWSWGWVLSPLWIGFILDIIIVITLFIWSES